MKFTPAQVRSIVGISDETLRYWKRRLFPLEGKRGHTPCYTHGELLALMVINLLVREFGMDISTLGAHAEALFKACHQSQWLRISDSMLVVSTNKTRVYLVESIPTTEFSEPCVVIPLGAVLEQLKTSLVEQDGDAQLELNWPPVSLSQLARKAHI